MENEDWKEEFETNVLGTVNFCQAVIPIMQRQGNGSIANVSSIRGINQLVSNRGMSYSISKVSVTGLTSALAKEFAPVIRVNAVAPGFTNTDMAKTWNDSVRKQANSALLGRVAEPKEIAAALLFLISDDSSFVTGQTLIVDGGYGLAGK
jgi:NAD(P)-dependent dehydrogenase (short-subunit alcohol dehydrogenase family)